MKARISERNTRQKASKTAKGADRAVDEPSPMDGVISYKLRRAQLWVFQDFVENFAPIDLRPAEFSVLRILGERPGLRHAEVARMLGIKRTNFVALMDALEKRGLADRRTSGADRRSHALFLTSNGEKFLKSAMEIFHWHEENLVRRLGGPKARDALIELLSKLVDQD